MEHPWQSVCWEHYEVLKQILGKEQARDFHGSVAREHGCTHCGAGIGEPCTVEGSTRPVVGYVHKPRRNLVCDEVQRRVWELTGAIVEDRRAGRRATEPVSNPSAIELPRMRLRPKLPGYRDPDADEALGVRLGRLVSRVQRARDRDESAWRELADAGAELREAERDLANLAARAGVPDLEALLAPEVSR